MASEAQRLIGISLTKIAQSRQHRGGVSLHKNLLVATVLQKARYMFMEEAYNMVHYQTPTPISRHHQLQQQQQQQEAEDDLVALTAEEASSDVIVDTHQESSSTYQEYAVQEAAGCVKCLHNQNKENHSPCYSASGCSNSNNNNNNELTYLDLDNNVNNKKNVLSQVQKSCLKRRRTVGEWETEEAVQSILPKRSKQEEEEEDEEDDEQQDEEVFLENDATSSSSSSSSSDDDDDSLGNQPPSMEIDRITSLVSIFSFNMGDKLNRSDLCSTQAKDEPAHLQQRPFLAMTV